MKRIFSILLVAILVVTTLSTVAAAKEAKPGATVDIEVTVSGEFANYLIDIKADAGLTIKKISGAGASVISSATSARANWATSSNVTEHTIIVTVEVADKITCEQSYKVTATAQRASKAVAMEQDNDGIADGFIDTTVSVSGGSITVHHEWDEGKVTTEPTCEGTGVKTYTCSICGETKTETIPANGHAEGDWTTTKNPTCEEPGEEQIKCTVCGEVIDTREIPALGHDYEGTVTKAATCEEPGVMTYVCKNDASHTYTEPIDALGHDYKVETTTATCTEGGITTYICSRCGHSYTDNATAALGHDYVGTVTKAATCEEPGVMTYVCKNDPSHTYTEAIPALGHTWCEDFECEHDHDHFDDDYHWSVCLICGEKKDVERHDHSIEKNGYLFCECGHWIEVDEPGIDPQPKPGDFRLEMAVGFAAILSLIAAAAFVFKRKLAK